MRALLRASLVALALLSAGALTARADDGRPPVGTGHPPTPAAIPVSQLRPIDIRVAPVPTLDASSAQTLAPARGLSVEKELVLFVGGYGSQANDGAFDALKARFPADRYEVQRLGEDPRFPYDTYGSIDVSARVLTNEIRDRAPRYAAVNIVSHSMGGVVVDRAFANGLSSNDGVRTYIAIAGPHSGADFARVPTVVLPAIAPVKDIVRTVAVVGARDPESQAARDLSSARPITPPNGVARLNLNLATDGLVNEFDARDPNVERRIFLPASISEILDGHGGSLVNRQVADLIVETVRTHRVPPDRRDPLTVAAAPVIWDRETWLWRTVLFFATLAALALYATRFLPFCRAAADALNALCGRFLRSIGR